MACKGCDERREWMSKQIERAKERMRLCLQQLGVDADSKHGGTKQINGSAKPTNSTDHRSE
ncbi:hypothetical protein B9T31_09575 [Acinetobacter sp. ANC 4558]|uniref:hypothetical protein n=1 Tax=Acinetobacter sp. ANC 4558 TaxID=1977876 RepID=UPI000A350A45|nr:hypothetical protein [Acinetobacter sp. ANC 4558]OTG85835.1 hypothetical protein B9T31_09575 [Acinetobacter sp. ANC 4558]